ALMIICSCNVLTDEDVRGVIAAAIVPVRAAEVYSCLGCSLRYALLLRTRPPVLREPRAPDALSLGRAETLREGRGLDPAAAAPPWRAIRDRVSFAGPVGWFREVPSRHYF